MVRKSKALNEIGVAGSFPNCARRKSYKKENETISGLSLTPGSFHPVNSLHQLERLFYYNHHLKLVGSNSWLHFGSSTN